MTQHTGHAPTPTWRGLLFEYADYLDLDGISEVITLHEGNTPLVHARSLSEQLGANIYLKVDGSNPTGSFKDRGMTMAITKAKSRGATTVVCASTGNTSASAAAYAAKAGMSCVVLVPEGKIAMGKLAQAVMYGAQVIQVRGNFDQALRVARDAAEHLPITLVNSVNPDRLEGQKTAAFEIVDALGQTPDIVALPVGNAGNISAYWRGFSQWAEQGRCRLPRMYGFQAAGAAPLVHGLPIENPETVATAIRIGNPASWQLAMSAVAQSNGAIAEVSDEEILHAQRRIASSEGIFAEPASAISVAGLFKYGVPEGATVVCVLTGNGLKDPDTALASTPTTVVIDPTLEALRARII